VTTLSARTHPDIVPPEAAAPEREQRLHYPSWCNNETTRYPNSFRSFGLKQYSFRDSLGVDGSTRATGTNIPLA